MKTDPYMKGFMDCLNSETKGVFIRYLFVDINDGNWSDAALFSQVCYIFSQFNERRYRHYSIHEHDHHSWVSLSYAQWWDVCRLNQNTVKCVIKRVQDRSLIITEKIKTGGLNRLLIRINYEQFSKKLQSIQPLDTERSIQPLDTERSIQPLDTERSIQPLDTERSIQPLDTDRIDQTERSNRSDREIESIRPRDRIDLMTIYKDPEDLEEDQKEHSLRNPERVCAREKSPESNPIESFLPPSTPKTSPVFSSSIGDDNFSAAAPLNSSIEGFPIGPWGRDLFSIHAGFMAAVIAKWRKGDSQKAKTFGAMVDEEVRGCIQKYWRKDWANLHLDWTEYEDSTHRLAQTVRDRMSQGVEITSQEQKILTDRVMGPEHLQIRSTQPIALSPSDFAPQRTIAPFNDSNYPSNDLRCLPVALTGEIDPEELERTKQAIAAARASVKAPDNPVLWTYGKPSEGFQAWLMIQAQTNRIEGMTLRATTIALSQRPEMQTKYLKSLEEET